MSALNVRELGEYIREQRRTAQISLRQLARLAGVSNPYLSQIERGLRHPSAEILQQIARALRISAEALYVQAGILEERPTDSEVPAAVLADLTINERQRQVLLEIYDSFRRENDSASSPGQTAAPAARASRTPPGRGTRMPPDRTPATRAPADPPAGTKPRTQRDSPRRQPDGAGPSSSPGPASGSDRPSGARSPGPISKEL